MEKLILEKLISNVENVGNFCKVAFSPKRNVEIENFRSQIPSHTLQQTRLPGLATKREIFFKGISRRGFVYVAKGLR